MSRKDTSVVDEGVLIGDNAVEEDVLSGLSQMQQQKASAADPGSVRLADAERKSRCDGCVDGVSARREDLFSDRGRLRSARGDDASLCSAGPASVYHIAVPVERSETRGHV